MLHVRDDESVEEVARELCRATGQNPDAMIRLGQPISSVVGQCTIVKPLIVPAWKAYCREARRLAMADAEHANVRQEQRQISRRRRTGLRRIRISARKFRSALRRAAHRQQYAALPASDHSFVRWYATRLQRRLRARARVFRRNSVRSLKATWHLVIKLAKIGIEIGAPRLRQQ
jgi:hypothetical protein